MALLLEQETYKVIGACILPEINKFICWPTRQFWRIEPEVETLRQHT